MMDENLEPIDEQLARLGRSVAPARDLWPGIEARLEPRAPRFTWPRALAAALALVAVTAAVTALLVRTPPTIIEVAARHDPASSSVRFVSARTELRGTFERRLSLLSPQTRETVLNSLKLIEQARTDLERTLADDPGNPLLNDLAEQARRREFSLYQDVVSTTEPLAERS